MNFTTAIQIPKSTWDIDYQSKLMLIGSCFSEYMADKMAQAFMQVQSNPFGILYNPASIAQCLQMVHSNKIFTAADLISDGNLWHSWAHHGSFSCASQTECLAKINTALTKSHAWLTQADVLVLTFGTAWVYEKNGCIVGNCHKQPANEFTRRRLSVSEIVEMYANALTQTSQKVIFTVSPVRHWKDGAHENQLSKSTLLLAIDEICRQNANCFYFPSYELLLDELRDYRFYAEDMLHPSTTAVEYIWQRFAETFFSAKMHSEMAELQQLSKDLNHRPLHADSPQYAAFRAKTAAKKALFQAKYPWLRL